MSSEHLSGAAMNERVQNLGPVRPGNLWAITCYFNPVGYKRRLENYYIFRQRLVVPLLTVELSFDGNFHLQQRDADILVQLHGSDVMWQKERLLNVALKLVPEACTHIAWLDCDVVFESSGWAERAIQALDQFALLRLFHQRNDLSPDSPLDQLCLQGVRQTAKSVVDKVTGEAVSAVFEDLLLAANPLERVSSPGLAWASRRDMLEKHSLYDACILGSGDRAVLYAALGQFDQTARTLRMGARRYEHYLDWAKPFFDSVQGLVGYLPGHIFHLWHGERSDREYRERQELLNRFDFDPYTDIAVDRNGCWCWNSDKRDLHDSVRRYFRLRKEDGRGNELGIIAAVG